MAKIESLSELDDYYKEKKREERMKRFPSKIVVMVVIILASLLLGIVVYLIVDSVMQKPEPAANESFIGEEIPLGDENVQILYQYVTYGAGEARYPKFVMNREVTLISFTEKEKLYYALQFAQPEDFKFTGKYNADKEKIYRLPDSKLNEYLQLFFGSQVTYKPEEQITYPFTFYINKKNIGLMKYNAKENGYDTIFLSENEVQLSDDPLPPVIGQLTNALRRQDGSIVLQERVVYTELRTDNGKFAVNIYKDPERTILLETINQLEEDQLAKVKVDFSNYESTAIVEYSFGVEGNRLYFESSTIML